MNITLKIFQVVLTFGFFLLFSLVTVQAILFFFVQTQRFSEAAQSRTTPSKPQIFDAQFTPPPAWTLAPRPTPTSLADQGVRALPPQEFQFSTQPRASNAPFSFLTSAADAKTVVGTIGALGNNGIVALDLASGVVSILDENPMSVPRVSGKYVVWKNASPPNELSVYDLAQRQLQKLSWNFEFVTDPRIAGNTLLFTGITDKPTDKNAIFWIYNLATQQSYSLGIGGAYPEISGDWVVFRAGSNPVELKAINIRTKEQISLGAAPPPDQYGTMHSKLYDIDAPWIAWGAGALDPQPILHLYNVVTRQSTSVPLPPRDPKIRKDIYADNFKVAQGIVIFSCRVNCYMAYNIQRKTFFTVPVQQPKTEDDGLLGWVIAGDKIIWQWRANVSGKDENRVYSSQIVPPPNNPPYP